MSRAGLLARCLREGRTLLHQQCWLWGQDVRRAEGNLLIERGFTRLRAPEGSAASSQYTLLEGDGVVRLWGFGLFFGVNTGWDYSGIYLNRYEFRPRLVRIARDIWQSFEAFECATLDPGTELSASACRWIAEYEAWVLREHGLSYRVGCLARWSKRGIPAAQLPARWRGVAESLALVSSLPAHASI